uniref:Family with sequence similarity 49 member A, like n=1 Tax=Scophthalmus maximus TaxID=52904 RepID=A0A8D3BRX1_SCOMX
MGNLIKVLGKDLENCPHFFLDFENAQPTEAETAVWNQVSAVLEEAHGILAELQSYNGAGQEIREAIQNPGDLALQEKAWNAVCPLVAKLKRFYEFSLRLENALRSLLEALTSPPYAPMQHLEREQALAKQFAEILHFTLSFDELKMTNPAIQNDFSYYRRTISRNRLNNQQLEAENEVNNEMANRMSLFYAEATPMLKTLSNATTKFVSENKTLPIEDTTDCLSTMACVCRVMLETPEYRCRFTNTDTMLFCMRVMVGVIILYDHVHPVGAFAKTSKIDVSPMLLFESVSLLPQQEVRWIGGCRPFSHPLCCLCADEGLHQGAERTTVQQCGGTSERTEVCRTGKNTDTRISFFFLKATG